VDGRCRDRNVSFGLRAQTKPNNYYFLFHYMPKQLRTPAPKGKRQLVDQPLIDQYFISPKKPMRGRSVKPSSNVNLNNAVIDRDGLAVPRKGLSVSEIIDVDLFEAGGPTASSSDSAVHVNPSGSAVPRIEVPNSNSGDSPSIIRFAAPSTKPIAFADLSIDSATYTPDSQPWPSRSAPYSFLAYALATVSATRSRTIIINVLTNALRTIILCDPSSLLSAIYLLSNTLTPSYTPVEMGLGASILSRSIQHVSGLTAPALKRLYNSTGDVGDVAFAAKSNLRTLVPHPPLMINYVYKSLLDIACCKGPGAAKDKQKIVEKLLVAAAGEEVRFLARTLTQNLRVGAVRASILTALSRAMVLIPLSHFGVAVTRSGYHASTELLDNLIPSPAGKIQSPDKARDELSAKFTQAESLVKRVYAQHPNYEHITVALLQTGLDGLEESVALTLGEPSSNRCVCDAYFFQVFHCFQPLVHLLDPWKIYMIA
jgi:DNA ligase-1